MTTSTGSGRALIVHYITVNDLCDYTGLQIAEVDDASLAIHRRIENSIIEFERDCDRAFNGTETDYALAQRAVAFLTAYNIHLFRRETEYAQIMRQEYNRVIRLLRRIPDERDTPKKYFFSPSMYLVTQENLDG